MGLAADPDFTENLLMRYLPKSKIDEIYEKGVADIAWGEVSQDFFWCLEVVGIDPFGAFQRRETSRLCEDWGIGHTMVGEIDGIARAARIGDVSELSCNEQLFLEG